MAPRCSTGGTKQCSNPNCGTTTATQWRTNPDDGRPLCNPCGQYYRTHGNHRVPGRRHSTTPSQQPSQAPAALVSDVPVSSVKASTPLVPTVQLSTSHVPTVHTSTVAVNNPSKLKGIYTTTEKLSELYSELPGLESTLTSLHIDVHPQSDQRNSYNSYFNELFDSLTFTNLDHFHISGQYVPLTSLLGFLERHSATLESLELGNMALFYDETTDRELQPLGYKTADRTGIWMRAWTDTASLTRQGGWMYLAGYLWETLEMLGRLKLWDLSKTLNGGEEVLFSEPEEIYQAVRSRLMKLAATLSDS